MFGWKTWLKDRVYLLGCFDIAENEPLCVWITDKSEPNGYARAPALSLCPSWPAPAVRQLDGEPQRSATGHMTLSRELAFTVCLDLHHLLVQLLPNVTFK